MQVRVAGTLVLAATCALAVVSPAAAATIEVPGDFATIQAAVDAAATGDTVAVRARKSPYRENVEVETDGIAIRGVEGRPIVDGFAPGLDPPVIDVSAEDVEVRNLALRNGNALDCVGDGCAVRDVTFRGLIQGDCIEIRGSDALVADSRMEACGNNGVDLDGDDGRLLRNRARSIDSDCFRLQGTGHLFRSNSASFCEDGVGLTWTGSGNADGVITDNTVKATDNGGFDIDGDGMTLTANLAELNDDDCFTVDGDGTSFEDNVGRDCDNGVNLTGDGVVATGNQMSDVADSECLDLDGNEGVVSNNRVDDCWKGIDASGENPVIAGNRVVDVSADDGIRLSCFDDTDPPDPVPQAAACTDARVAGNTIDGTGDDDAGLSVFIDEDTGSAVVRGNVVRDAFDDGIEAFMDNGLIEGNTTTRAGAEEEEGLDVFGGGNLIRNNVSTRNGGHGIRVHGDEVEDAANVLRNNVVRDNNQNGIRSATDSDVVVGNSATDNVGDGIEIDGLAVDVRDNFAAGNGGVDCAVDGSIDEFMGNDCEDGSDFLLPSSGIGN